MLRQRAIRAWAGALCACALFTLILAGSPVLAAPEITVSGAKLVASAIPGDTITHKITVSMSGEGQPQDFTVSVSPVVQTLDGAPRPSPDAGPYSAAPFITLDKESFRLDPDEEEVITATIRIPFDVGDGGRYAVVSISTRSSDGGKVSVITGVDVPMYITIKGSSLTHSGSITSLSAEVRPCQGIEAVAVLENKGNHDFKTRATFTLRDSKGRTVARADAGLSIWTIIPGMAREIGVTLIPKKQMPPGQYRLASQMTLEGGTIVAQGNAVFELGEVFSPPVPSPGPTQATSPLNGRVMLILAIAGIVIAALAFRLFGRRSQRGTSR